MAYDDPTIARVGKNGYRVLAPLDAGTRKSTEYPNRAPSPGIANPTAPAGTRATRAAKPAGYTG